jgi:hypothetical protein
MELILIEQAISRGYCTSRNCKKILDPDLVEDMANEVFKANIFPQLGCATTRELLDEITARIEVDEKLDYKTINGK